MKLGIGVFTLAFGMAAFGGQAFRAHVGLGLFRSFVEAPIHQTQSLSDYVTGTAISGTAVTNGHLTVDFIPWADGAAIGLRLATQTDSHTIGTNTPRQDISVNIWSTAHTTMNSAKGLYLYPDRVATGPASSRAVTALEFHGVNADASGLFWRLKERIAYRKAWEQVWATKAQNEYRVSVKAVTEMNAMLDSKADPLVTKLNKYYQNYFYRPFFTEGVVPGRLGFSTTADRLTASVWDADTDGSVPGETSSAIGFRVAERLLSRMGSQALAGRHMDDADVEEFLILAGITSTAQTVPAGETGFEIDFCEQDALKVELSGGNLGLTLCAKHLQIGDAVARDTHVRFNYAVGVSAAGALVGTLTGIEFGATYGEKVPPGTEALNRRLRTLFPETLEFGPFTLPGKFGQQGDLRASRVQMENGWAQVDWELR